MSRGLRLIVVIISAAATETFAEIRIPINRVPRSWVLESQSARHHPSQMSSNAAEDDPLLNTNIDLYSAAMKLNLTNNNDFFYTVELKAGSPEKILHVALDTGSPSLVLRKGSIYTPQKSAKIQSNKKIDIPYGIGDAHGVVVQDQVCWSDLCVQQTFLYGECTVVPKGVDGILGLAPEAAATLGPVAPNILSDKKTFVQSISAAGKFNDLAIFLHMRGAKDPAGSSFAILGEHAELEEKYAKTCVSAPFANSRYLLEPTLSVVVKKKIVGQTQMLAGLDTGSTNIVVPADQFDAVVQAVVPDASNACVGADKLDPTLPQGRKVCSCNTYIGDLVWTFASKNGKKTVDIALKRDDYVTYFGKDPENGEDLCLLGLMEGPYADFWILGDVFFRQMGVIFGANIFRATICPKSVGNVAQEDEDLEDLEEQVASGTSLTKLFVLVAGVSLVTAAFVAIRRTTQAKDAGAAYVHL